jgi:Uma2 family endonuclease
LKQYVRMEIKEEERIEFFNGSIVQAPDKRGTQNLINANFVTAMMQEFDKNNFNYLTFASSQKVYLPSSNVVFYADASVVCDNPQFWDNDEELLINPVLIVEVLSKSTDINHRLSKFSAYKTLKSLKEYVLIDSYSYEVETRYIEEPDLWRDTVVNDIENSIFLKSLGCSIKLSDIYEFIEFPPQKPKKLPKR